MPAGFPSALSIRIRLLGSTSFDVAPVGADADFGDYGDAEFGDVFHLVLDQGAEFFGFGGDDVEEEFVVDLQGHARAQVACGDLGVDADHG